VGGRLYAATGRLQPFALAGIGALMATPVGPDAVEEAYGFASRFGLGLDFYVTRSYAVSATLSYVLATGDTRGSDWIGFRTSVVWRD